jgi:hypothetical protein
MRELPTSLRSDMDNSDQLISEIYGELYALADTEYPVYRSDGIRHCGLMVPIDVHCPLSLVGDRSSLLREVERRLQWFFDHEPVVRLAIADRVVRDMRDYWLGVGAEVPSGLDLLGSLVLTDANCFQDSRYESWYSLPEPVDHLDLSAVFDEGFVIHDVNFDG